jgi:hypothetical protein
LGKEDHIVKKDKAEKRFVMGAIGVFLLLTALPAAIHAGIPQAINYQGYLTDAQGVPVKGTVEMVFSIYNVAAGGSPLWTETQSVEVTEGVYNVILGAKASFHKSPALIFDVPYYLGVKVGEDLEMTPRMALTSVGYAFRAQWVEAVPPHDHDASYLNATGDVMDAASSGTVLSVRNTGTGYGISGGATGLTGRGVNGTAWGDSGSGVYGTAWGVTGSGVYGYGAGNEGNGVYGSTYGAYARGVSGNASGSEGYGGYFVASGDRGTGVYAKGGANGYAADFAGNVRIKHRVSGVTLIELGEGLDYAEGFEVSTPEVIGPGSVVVIDSDNPGKLTLTERPYDKRVAGIVAGAKGLGSGVRLGAGQYDCDVALAGRVYCNVDAGYGSVSTGDLLTTSPTPGFAMVVNDYHKAQGAILGKAMENIGRGEKRQILVLVTLQ